MQPDIDRLRSALTAAVEGPDDVRVPGVAASVVRSTGTAFAGATGAAEPGPMALDSVIALYSASKPLTGTAVLQCVQEGLIDLDAPASTYVPEIGELGVFTGFGADGAPQTRPVRTAVTTRMLLLHTAGFAYPFADETYSRLVADGHSPDVATAQRASLMTPLLFEPGTDWNYGTGVDWAGLVVEAVRGASLGEVLAERVFEPLGMASTGFILTDAMAERRASVHLRRSGALKATGIVMPQQPEVQMGGQGLYSTVEDYARFLRMWLRDGAGDGDYEGDCGRVLDPDTVAWASRSGLTGDQTVTGMRGVVPAVSHDVEFFPGRPKSWAYTFMVNDEPAPTGRSAGSLGWAGLANVYFWIDRAADLAGVWATQVLPFGDPGALQSALAFETEAYRVLR